MWLKVIAIVLAGLTVAVGTGAFFTAEKLSDKQKLEISRTNEVAGKANERAEREALKRVELAKTLARRSIPLVKVGGKTNIDRLMPFAGMEVIIEHLPEVEPRRAAEEIKTVLETSGWKIVGLAPNPELATSFWDGVVVEPYLAQRQDVPIEQLHLSKQGEVRPGEAANTLVSFLQSNNWVARRESPSPDVLPLNTIRVRVGFKPEPHVLTNEEEELARARGEDPDAPLPPQREQPRHVTESQRDSILKALAEEIPRDGATSAQQIMPVEIVCPEGNEEACAFGGEIADLLRNGRWPIVGNVVIRDRYFPRRLTGIVVRGRAENQFMFMSVAILHRAFERAGLEVSRDVRAMAAPDEPFRILVGW